MRGSPSIDVEQAIEGQNVSRFLVVTFGICAAVQILEGFDIVTAAYVGPLLVKSLHIERSSLGLIFSAGFLGLMLGAIIFGTLGDWFGRKSITIICTVTFGVFSLATVASNSLGSLVVLRFLTGLGIGGAVPTTVALLTEYSPRRIRGTFIMLMIAGLSIGAALGGVVAARIVPSYGWTSVFYVGGVLPIVFVPLLLLWLPESVRFLVLRKGQPQRVAAILRRALPTLVIGSETKFIVHEEPRGGFPVRHLFATGWGIATLLLWVTIFMNVLILAFYNQWMPTLLNAMGITLATASIAAAIFQVGGILGAFILGRLVDRYGFFIVIGCTYIAAAAFSLLIVSFGASATLINVLAFCAGVCIAGNQGAVNALSAALYPTAIRSTGSGWGVGVGRAGGVVGPILAGMLLSYHWSIPALFYASAIPALCGCVAAFLLAWRVARSPTIRDAQVPASESSRALRAETV